MGLQNCEYLVLAKNLVTYMNEMREFAGVKNEEHRRIWMLRDIVAAIQLLLKTYCSSRGRVCPSLSETYAHGGQKMKVNCQGEERRANFIAKPRGSRASSGEPDSPPTVLNRTARKKHRSAPSNPQGAERKSTCYGSLEAVFAEHVTVKMHTECLECRIC